MLQIGVWEHSGELSGRIAALCAESGALVRGATRPESLTGQDFALLVVSPQAAGGAGALRCQTALVPGGMAALCRNLSAGRLLSYGVGSANTLTISSLGESQASVAVQREFDALTGARVERQELVLPYNGGPPELLLALAGAALLLTGVPSGGCFLPIGRGFSP